MDEIGGAAQMLQVSIQGLSLAGRATVETARIMQRVLLISASFLKFIATIPHKSRKYFKYKKNRGKTNIDNLKQKGGTLEIASFSDEGYKMFKKKAKKWGILFHENPTFKKDKKGRVYISYPVEQAPVMEKIIEAMKNDKVKEFKEKAEKEASDLGLKGKERKEFITASIQNDIYNFQSENYMTDMEEYCRNSGVRDCTNAEFDEAMKECYGEAYDDVKAEMNNQFKKKNFDTAVDELSMWRENAEPAYICERNNPESYIKVSWQNNLNREGKEYLASEFEVYCNGEKQKCDEFAHGMFSHYSWKNGNQSSQAGERHWNSMKMEMKQKGGFSDEILVFGSEKEYLQYKKQCEDNRDKEKEFKQNSRKEERDKRVNDGSGIFNITEDDIVDVDREEGQVKIDTGIKDENGRNYFLWISKKDLYYKKENNFEILFDENRDITLTNFSGNQKVKMPAVKFMEKTGIYDMSGEREQKKQEKRKSEGIDRTTMGKRMSR